MCRTLPANLFTLALIAIGSLVTQVVTIFDDWILVTRRWIAWSLVPLVVASLAGCADSGPQAQDAAAALAKALASRDVSAIPFTEVVGKDAQDHLSQVFDALKDTDLAVTAEKVTTDKSDDQLATAAMNYTWQVTEDKAWTYTTQVGLELVSPDDGDDRWEIAWTPQILVPGLRSGERLTTERVQPERADILGQDGQQIVTEQAVWHIGLDKTRIDAAQWDAQARILAGIVNIDAEPYAQKVAGAGEKAFVEAITIRQSDTSVDMNQVYATEGVLAVEDELPLAPTRDFARPILGRAGEATAEIVEESGGTIATGDTVGLSGLQRQYDDQLRGSPGLAIVRAVPQDAQDPAATEEEESEPTEVFRVEAVNGTPLQTTLDLGLQQRAESLLEGIETPSAIVAIRPSTGDVLVAASGTAGEGLSTATTGQYAPGSTFKVVTALAAMRGGLTPEQPVACSPQITTDGYTFSNVPGYPAGALGDVPFRTAFANSCNTAMISLAGSVTQQALHDAASDLGLGAPSEFGAAAYWGDVPIEGNAVDHAASMIGQGKIQASPLTMATVAASVRQGERVAPVLVRPDEAFAEAGASGDSPDAGTGEGADDAAGEGDEDTASASEAPATAAPSPSNLTAEEAETLRSLMHSVVTDGSASVLADLGDDVGAKTGTAQYGDGAQSHAWMIAYSGDLAVAVFLETGDSGATTAGPIMRAFLGG